MPNYKIKAFQTEKSERFESFYSLSESLKKVILVSASWAENGPEPDLLDAMCNSLRSLDPVNEVTQGITKDYVKSMLSIVSQAETLSVLIRVDSSLGQKKLDQANSGLLQDIAVMCENNDQMLYSYRSQHEGGMDYSNIEQKVLSDSPLTSKEQDVSDDQGPNPNVR